MKHFGGPQHTAHSKIHNYLTRKNNKNNKNNSTRNNNSTRKNNNDGKFLKEHFEEYVLRKGRAGYEGFWKGLNKTLNSNNSSGVLHLLEEYKDILEDKDFIESQRKKLKNRKIYNKYFWILPKDFDKVYDEELKKVNYYLEKYDT